MFKGHSRRCLEGAYAQQEEYDTVRGYDTCTSLIIKPCCNCHLLSLSPMTLLTCQVLGTATNLGIAGVSASLLTSILESGLEDLLALALCSVGGYVIGITDENCDEGLALLLKLLKISC